MRPNASRQSAYDCELRDRERETGTMCNYGLNNCCWTMSSKKGAFDLKGPKMALKEQHAPPFLHR